MITLDDFTDKLRDMLGNDNPEGVIRHLRAILQELEGEKFHTVLNFNAELSSLRQREIRGMAEDPTVERARIRHRIYQFLDTLEIDEVIIIYYENHRNEILNKLGIKPPSPLASPSTSKPPTSSTGRTLSGNKPLGATLVLSTSDSRVSEGKVEINRETLLGRDGSCDVVIQDDRVSRRHAFIYKESGEIWVEDPGSRNGTYVNGRRVMREKLQHGCILQLYDLVFQVEFK